MQFENKSFLKGLVAMMLVATLAFTTSCSDDDDDDNGSSCSQSATNPDSLPDPSETLVTDSDGVLGGGSGEDDEADFLRGDITESVQIPADATVWLDGTVTIREGAKLVIGAGATIKGNTDSLSYLIIERGAAIVAEGTEDKPITFTSGVATGSRANQDWGGLIINGKASLNSGDEAYGEGNSGLYGGCVDNDNSGTLKYVRVMFAGKDFNADNELNGIALQGVGSGTTIDYIQVHNNKDDGIEMFGGNVNIRHLIATGNGDDQIDATDGWRGTVQYAIAAPISGDKGLEHDGNGDITPQPYTQVVYSNLTVLITADGDDDDAIRNREGSIFTYYNTYVGDYSDGAGSAVCVNNSDGTATITMYNSVLDNCATETKTVDDPATDLDNIPVTLDDTVSSVNTANYLPITAGAGNELATMTSLASQDGSIFAPSTNNTTDAIDASTVTLPTGATYQSFDAAQYIGAVSASDNWLANATGYWVEFPEN